MIKKYTLLTLAIAGLLIFSGVRSAAAATQLNFLPLQISRNVGQTFDAVIYVTPAANEKVYSAKVEVDYRPDILEVTHFSYDSKVIALSQPGYDELDNSKGTLIKTAGFPGGITSSTILGTITFRVKAAGTSAVIVGNGSMVLNQSNANIVNPSNGTIMVTTGNPQVLGASTVAKKTTSTGNSSTSKKRVNSSTIVSTTTPTTTDSAFMFGNTASNTATSGSVLGASIVDTTTQAIPWVAIAVGIVILLIVIGLVYSIARGV